MGEFIYDGKTCAHQIPLTKSCEQCQKTSTPTKEYKRRQASKKRVPAKTTPLPNVSINQGDKT